MYTSGIRFQFLIGRLKTSLIDKLEVLESMFQFLIGRLKTHHADGLPITSSLFQFLIGRLKTYIYILLIMLMLHVSIPYR